VYGAQRPAYPSKTVDRVEEIHEWMDFMASRGIGRVCCLLPPDQLAYYRAVNLLAAYRSRFSASNVCSAPVEDYRLCDVHTLDNIILPFLRESNRIAVPVVVHCSGGSGRTGHVLAAWLVRHRGFSTTQALSAVIATGRNPFEAVQHNHATDEQLTRLICGPAALDH